jgi:hypothetical protein
MIRQHIYTPGTFGGNLSMLKYTFDEMYDRMGVPTRLGYFYPNKCNIPGHDQTAQSLTMR